MNTRPSRVPSPGHVETSYVDTHTEASFHEMERANNLPANRLPDTEMHSSPIMSVRDEAATVRAPIENVSNLIGAIAAVMAEITPVEKGGWNKFHGYAHARIQDLLAVLTPLMGKHGIVIWQNEEGRELFDQGKCVAVRYRFTVAHKSGEIWPDLPLQTGLANCRDTKGGFDDKALNKCHTAARKYFLLSLFQIPTEDMVDADADGKPPTAEDGKRPPGRRQVPSPDGKIRPHLLPIVNKEAPADWANRLKEFVDRAGSKAEIDAWYDANKVQFDKLQIADAQTYNDALDFMDACETKFTGGYSADAGKPDPISSGPAVGPGKKPADPVLDDFPGGPMVGSKAMEAWLNDLDVAFGKCTDSEELAEEQKTLMMPSKDSVSETTWKAAIALVKKHLERVQA